MDGEHIYQAAEAGAADPAERSLIDDLRLLAGDARTLAEAEFAYQRSRAQVFSGGIGKIVALGLGAFVLVSLALIGLVVGLVIALAPILTAWGATAVVVVALVVLAAVAALCARTSWHKLTDIVG